MNNKTWNDIWCQRSDEPMSMSHLDLLKANGYDNLRSALIPDTLEIAQDFYLSIIRPSITDTFYEVGCGSGAFLYGLKKKGYAVSGMDLSANLVEIAKINVNDTITSGNASDLDVREKHDHVMAFGLFLYFPSLEFAENILEKMILKANRTVSLYDIPDLAKMEDCENMRRKTTPNYDKDYAGLKHLYFSKQWFCDFAQRNRLHLTIFDQVIPGYENGKYRFCVTINKNL
jgi:SAM-dependent methyltransferase